MKQAQKLEQHVRSIARKHKIRVKKYQRQEGDPPGLQAYSDDEERYIEIPPIRSRVSYAIAMHEIGHILGPWQNGTKMEREAGAWKWARENCLQWGRVEDATMHRGMLSYVELALEECMSLFKKPMRIPPTDHYFWQCLPPISKAPSWLHASLFTVPWREVLDDPERPRCATCAFWAPHHREGGKRSRVWGTCLHPKEPMGVRPMTPESALCGTDYRPTS